MTLANEFARQDIETHLLILRNNIEYKLNTKINLHIMSEEKFSGGFFRSINEIVKGCFWVRKILIKNKDQENTTLLSHLVRSNIINIVLGIFNWHHKAICVSHNSVGFYRGRGILKKIFLISQGVIFPLAFRTVCVSKRIEMDYKSLFLFRKESVVNICNPIDLNIVMNSDKSPKAIDDLVINIAMIGRIHLIKRHDLAIRAICLLNNRSKLTYKLHIVGDGPEENNIKRYINQNKFDSFVIMHGWLENTQEILGCANLSILCSDSEGFPNSIVESLACGKPVVATDCVSGPRELLAPEIGLLSPIDFVDGFSPVTYGALVGVGDAVGLANGIEYVSRNLEVYKESAMIEYVSRFDASTISRQYIQILNLEKV